MLFHSFEFIFVFLPIALLGFVLINRLLGWSPALAWLGAASIFFYGQWSLPHAALLSISILLNYGVIQGIHRRRNAARSSLPPFVLGVAANLTILGYLKYANFFIDNVNLLVDAPYPYVEVLLPVGISFYTFIQIGYLVEAHIGQVRETSFTNYFVFASFFPCVTAGPIILQKDMMGQFREGKDQAVTFSCFAIGLTVFAFGLFKKLVLADNIAPFADAVFDAVAGGAVPTAGLAWMGTVAYTLQLYFDFSGYSDMALGAAYMFGFKLPLNFNSPLKACSIIDFWRRWHMTMTRFFTNYLYSPLGVAMMRRSIKGQYGPAQRFLASVALPVVFTFVLAGLWHGAGWTFVCFGAIHGVALATNHAWRQAGLPVLPAPVCWCLTMLVVLIGLVFFRAADVSVALTIVQSQFGLAQADAPSFSAMFDTFDFGAALVWLSVLTAIALAFPNTQQILHRYWFSSDPQQEQHGAWPAWLAWRPSPSWAVACAVIILASLGSISGDTEFIYYKF